MAKRPLDLLHAALNQRVVVEVRGGRQYRGVLDGYDHPHLNVVVRDADEIRDGESVRKSSHVILRGDSIVYISP
jgi:small nuclear ribonucleoprotein